MRFKIVRPLQRAYATLRLMIVRPLQQVRATVARTASVAP
jgi:hypothetical protein